MNLSITSRNTGWENNTWVKHSCVFILQIMVWSWTCRFAGFPSVWLGVISSPWRRMKAYFSEMVSKPRQASSVCWEMLLVLVLVCAALLWSTLYTSLSLTLLSKWIWLCKASLLYLFKKRFSAIHVFVEIASYVAGADNKRYCHIVSCCHRHLCMCTSSVLRIIVFWVFTPCGVVDLCQYVECTCCLHLQGEGIVSRFLLKWLGWECASVT